MSEGITVGPRGVSSSLRRDSPTCAAAAARPVLRSRTPTEPRRVVVVASAWRSRDGPGPLAAEVRPPAHALE